MKTKIIPCPGRLRHVPRQFSWIDQRLVRDRHIRGRSPDSLALYLLLCTVADAQGLSYYSDATAGDLLGMDTARLRAARDELAGAGLIGWQRPFYQVLSLEPRAAVVVGSPASEPRVGEVRRAGEILQALIREAR